jgi:hypothetical protein
MSVLDLAFPPAAAPDTDHQASLRRASAVALAALALLQLADILTTRAMIARGAIESNPLAAVLLPSGHVEMVKAALVVVLAYRVHIRRPTVAFTAALWFGAGIYCLTVISNLLILNRLG